MLFVLCLVPFVDVLPSSLSDGSSDVSPELIMSGDQIKCKVRSNISGQCTTIIGETVTLG